MSSKVASTNRLRARLGRSGRRICSRLLLQCQRAKKYSHCCIFHVLQILFTDESSHRQSRTSSRPACDEAERPCPHPSASFEADQLNLPVRIPSGEQQN